MVSERKLKANRRNAKRSTGPKDTRRSRHNAQRHGLLSQAAIIQSGDAKEDPLELTALLDDLWEDFEPEGAMEEILVDHIVSSYWRLRRVQRAEVGEIQRAVEIMGSMDPIALPLDGAQSKILRYETPMVRQMYRSLKELRELQAARRARSTR